MAKSNTKFVILVKPRIDRTNLKPIIVRAGKPVKYDVDVKGEPAPTITWYHVDKELKSADSIEIINVDYNTKITLNNTVRKNTGVYKIKAVNEHGSDEAEVEVTVLCKSIKLLQLIQIYLLLWIFYFSISIKTEGSSKGIRRNQKRLQTEVG